MTLPMPRIDTTIENLNRQLHMSFEEKVKLFETMERDPTWMKGCVGIRSTEDLTEILVRVQRSLPNAVFAFTMLDGADLIRLQDKGLAKDVASSGIVLFLRNEH